MSIGKIRAALESRLNGLSPALPTAWENVPYSPTTGTAWQRVNLLVNTPVDYAVSSDVVEQRRILKVTLFYPQGTGAATAATRAQSVADRFAPVQTLTSGGVNVEILSTAHIGTATSVDEWFVIPISVPWRSFA